MKSGVPGFRGTPPAPPGRHGQPALVSGSHGCSALPVSFSATPHLLGDLVAFLDSPPEPRIVMDADYHVGANRLCRDFRAANRSGAHLLRFPTIFFGVCDQAGESY